MDKASSRPSKMNPTIKDILVKSTLNADTERDQNSSTIQNDLFNDESLSYFIQANFKTRGTTPMKNSRWKTAFYVDEVCSDKSKIMKKLRKIKYGEYFGSNFTVQKIDTQFKDLENQEKVKVMDNVIDFLF